MKNSPTLQSGLFTLRGVVACALLCSAFFLLLSVFAASPPNGTITPTGPNLAWTGTAPGIPPTGGGEASCVEGTNCDSFALTISGTPADWIAAAKQVHVQINWSLPANDYDMYVHKGTLSGPVVASSGNAGTTQEQVDLNPGSSSIGTGLFTVHVVYYIATQVDQYSGVATLASAASPPVPAPTPASGFAPRYETYTPPAAGPATLGLHAGEPSIGIGLGVVGHPEGRSMFQADIQTLRTTFNGECDSTRAIWENKPPVTSQVDFDPILFTDRTTGETIVHLLTFAGQLLVGESSFSLNDGDTWTPSSGTGIASGIDHQTVGGGPYHSPLDVSPPGTALHPIYYCSQALVDASCARSDNFGANYGPSVVIYTSQCGGLHGHVKVGPDGTVYVPNKGCGGGQGVVVSEDNGLTWNVRTVPGSTAGGSDPSVGIDATGRVYFGYADGDTKAAIATSDNHGVTWNQPLDVGVALGLNNAVFPAVMAGDSNRAAFGFLGTPTAGGLQGARFTGIWHLYVATTFDGGATWQTVDSTPNDPVQRGCVWQGGGSNICRNMLDFIDLQIDQQGRVLIPLADGCAGGECAQAGPNATGNSYTAFSTIVRQTGGRRLLAAFDPPEVATAPGTPFVTTKRNGNLVSVGWSTGDGGGSPITGYNILRSTVSGAETFLVSVPGSQRQYVDTTATNTAATYYYKVQAVNAIGTSCGNNEVGARYVGSTSSGFTVSADPTGDQVGGPLNADLDIQSLSVSEPATGPNAGKLVFKLQVANLSTITPNRRWRIIWDSPISPNGQYYVGMTSDVNGAITYEYGTVLTQVVGLVLGVPTAIPLGAPDSGTYTTGGLITIAVSKDKIGNPATGDLLGAFSTRTYPDPGNMMRSTDATDTTANATSNDFTANAATYVVTGPYPGLTSAVSRKVHGGAGTFDILLPAVGGPGIECRTGGTGGNHQVVFTFVGPVTLGSATVTAPLGGSVLNSSVAGNVVTVNLQGITNGQTVTVNLLGMTGAVTGDLSVPMGVLAGDTTADSTVNSADIGQTKSKSGQVVDSTNFRNDVTVDGSLNSADIGLVKSKSGTALSAPLRRR
ncbi:MAG: sialidase family protein [Chthoniobacterales bacterium]